MSDAISMKIANVHCAANGAQIELTAARVAEAIYSRTSTNLYVALVHRF
jgi:hypothetical protein